MESTGKLRDGDDMHVGTALRLLSEIDSEAVVSQHSLSTRMGVAVGLTNAYIKRCVRKGWIKIQRVPARRYAYFITPDGFMEKSRLVAEFLTHSFGFFRKARSQCVDLLREAQAQGRQRVLLFGIGDLAEVAVLGCMELNMRAVAIIAPGSGRTMFAGLPVLDAIEKAEPFDCVLLTDIQSPHQSYQHLAGRIAEDALLVPALLHVTSRRTRQDVKTGGSV